MNTPLAAPPSPAEILSTLTIFVKLQDSLAGTVANGINLDVELRTRTLATALGKGDDAFRRKVAGALISSTIANNTSVAMLNALSVALGAMHDAVGEHDVDTIMSCMSFMREVLGSVTGLTPGQSLSKIQEQVAANTQGETK
jgi:hypothetical protein